MNYVIDLVLILIFTCTIFVYWKRGFVKSVLGFGKAILAVIFSAVLGSAVDSFIAEKFMNAKLTNVVFEKISGMYEAGAATFDLSVLGEKIPESLSALAEKCGADIPALIEGNAAETAASSERLYEISANIALPISKIISNIFGYVLVFIVAYLLLVLVTFVVDAVTNIPIIRGVNKLLGLCLGVVCAIVFTYLFAFVLKAVIYFSTTVGNESQLLEIVNKTFIFKFIV